MLLTTAQGRHASDLPVCPEHETSSFPIPKELLLRVERLAREAHRGGTCCQVSPSAAANRVLSVRWLLIALERDTSCGCLRLDIRAMLERLGIDQALLCNARSDRVCSVGLSAVLARHHVRNKLYEAGHIF